MPSPSEGGASEAMTGPSRSPSGGARAGGAGSATGVKSQVVQVVLANGNSQVRLAELDVEAGKLVLWQLNEGENGEVDVGNQASIKLALIGDASAEESSVVLRAGGPSGRMLMRLDFSDEELARAWAPAICGARPGSGAAAATAPAPAPASPSRGAQPASDDEGSVGGSHADMLRVLVEQLQQQATLLELINKRKEDQLYELQAELEWALQRLQEGQEEYARQHRELENNQQVIEGLRQRAQAAGAAEAACAANAAQAAAGAAAAARAGATGPVARVAPVPAALGLIGGLAAGRSPASPASPAGPTWASPAAACSPAASPGVGAGGSKAPAPSPSAGPRPMDKESELLAQQQLLDKLKALEDEKGMLERALAEEQGEVQSQLRDLQGMMAALGL